MKLIKPYWLFPFLFLVGACSHPARSLALTPQELGKGCVLVKRDGFILDSEAGFYIRCGTKTKHYRWNGELPKVEHMVQS